MVVDGGTLETGAQLVEHLRANFGQHVVLSHVVLTHPDADHASGLRTLLEEIPVTHLWLHIPWLHAAACLPYFENKNWTVAGLVAELRSQYNILVELVDIAVANGTIVHEPFAGETIGPFQVLSPHQFVYDLFLPQFPRTPAPDQTAIEAQGAWIGKPPSNFLAQLFEKATEKLQKWVSETWETERLKDGGTTSASNESSVILHGAFNNGPVLLTGDAGVWALTLAANRADKAGIALQNFSFVQIPHHGSRRNVGPTILNRILGPIQLANSVPKFSAFVSARADDDTHPRKMVTNAFMRRGGTVTATQGSKKVYPYGPDVPPT
jgi:beta-lactamase superfamily II metal-dependent hydrolase